MKPVLFKDLRPGEMFTCLVDGRMYVKVDKVADYNAITFEQSYFTNEAEVVPITRNLQKEVKCSNS